MSSRRPWLFLTLMTGAMGVHLAWHLPRLPDRIASHFGPGGRADGWMSPGGFVLFEVGVLLLLGASMLGSVALTRRLPARFINLPNRDHWLAPEHREEAVALLLGQIVWLLVWTVALFIATNQLVFAAQFREGAPQLSEAGMAWVLGVALTGLGFWVWRLFWVFRRPH